MLRAALAGGHRRSALRLRAVRPAAARRPALRRRGRHRPGAATRCEQFRFDDDDARLPARARRRRRRDRSTGWPTTASPATSGAIPRARSTSPARPLLVVEGTLRRVRAAGDGAAADLQPRLRDRLRRVPDDRARRAAGRASRWARGAPTSWPRSPPPGPRTSPASPPPPTSRPGRRYGVPTIGTAAHAFTLLHDTERDAFEAQVEALGRGHDPAGRHLRRDDGGPRPAVELTGAGSARSGSTPATCGVLASQVRQQLDELGATQTRIIVTSDLDEYAIAALSRRAGRRVRRRHALVTGSGHPTCGFVYKLVARADSDEPGAPLRPVAKKSTDKTVDRRPQVGAAPARRRRGRRGRGDRRSASRPTGDGDDRAAAGAAGPRRRDRRRASRWRRPRAAPRRVPSCRWTPRSCPAASR